MLPELHPRVTSVVPWLGPLLSADFVQKELWFEKSMRSRMCRRKRRGSAPTSSNLHELLEDLFRASHTGWLPDVADKIRSWIEILGILTSCSTTLEKGMSHDLLIQPLRKALQWHLDGHFNKMLDDPLHALWDTPHHLSDLFPNLRDWHLHRLLVGPFSTYSCETNLTTSTVSSKL